MTVRAVMVRFILQVDVKFNPAQIGLLPTRGVKVEAIQTEFGEFPVQSVQIKAEIDQRAQEHVTADPAENIQVEGLHGFISGRGLSRES